ncbi:MAG: rRNA methyltransferase, partial [Actinomyces succiniciruminis]|nr:rRNA methyltransferase [Actinomyces succiniciruminis]
MIIPLETLDDAADPRLADYTRLTDVALRRRLETERGLYMAESTKVITRAVAAGHAPRSFLMAPRHWEQMRPVIAAASGCDGRDDGGRVPVFIAPEELLETLTGFHLHRGALAAMNRPALAGVTELLARARGGAGARRIAILEDLVDHTNVGAVFRSAAALGIDAVLVTPHCADPL